MTITIAAIVIGIGIDNAIHYLHRFKLEVESTDDPYKAVTRSHASIGSAIYFTSLTIIAGFSILVFSNFVPTVYFGLFTSLAMLLALMANLLILPMIKSTLSPTFKSIIFYFNEAKYCFNITSFLALGVQISNNFG